MQFINSASAYHTILQPYMHIFIPMCSSCFKYVTYNSKPNLLCARMRRHAYIYIYIYRERERCDNLLLSVDCARCASGVRRKPVIISCSISRSNGTGSSGSSGSGSGNGSGTRGLKKPTAMIRRPLEVCDKLLIGRFWQPELRYVANRPMWAARRA